MDLLYLTASTVSRPTARIFCILTVVAVAACDKVPLLAPTQSTITLTVSTTALGVNGTAQIIATVIEQSGTPVQNGTMVTFTGSLGSFDPPEASTTNGKATTTFRPNGQSGAASIGAVSGGAKAEPVVVNIGGAAAGQVVVRAEPATVSVNGGSVEIVASVTDASGNGLGGVPVVFSATNGTLSSNTAVTDNAGTARTSLQTTRTSVVTAAVGTKTATVTVNAVTLPNVTITVASGAGGQQPEVGTPITFTVTTPSTSGANSNPIRNVVVDFGDGTQENLGALNGSTTISHTYQQPGTYRVTATATDTDGLTNSGTTTISVSERSPITVTMEANPNPVCTGPPPCTQGGLVEFRATASVGSSFTSAGLTYFWNFGDGTTRTTTGGSTNHAYTRSGTFTASVRVRGPNGQEGFAERTIRVTQ
jgi:PKD repeat protein